MNDKQPNDISHFIDKGHANRHAFGHSMLQKLWADRG